MRKLETLCYWRARGARHRAFQAVRANRHTLTKYSSATIPNPYLLTAKGSTDMARLTPTIKKTLYAILLCGFAQVAGAADFEAPLTACVSNGTAIGGVNSCGKIWKLKSGKAELKAGGKLEVEVRGLVLNDASVGQYNGTPDGVDAVAAAVICHGPSGAAVAAEAPAVALSQKGDAKIKVTLSLPNGCVAPVIVLRERYEGKIGGWLAGTGI